MAGSGCDYIAWHEPMHREPINAPPTHEPRPLSIAPITRNRNTVSNSESGCCLHGGRLVAYYISISIPGTAVDCRICNFHDIHVQGRPCSHALASCGRYLIKSTKLCSTLPNDFLVAIVVEQAFLFPHCRYRYRYRYLPLAARTRLATLRSCCRYPEFRPWTTTYLSLVWLSPADGLSQTHRHGLQDLDATLRIIIAPSPTFTEMGTQCFDKCPSVAILSHHHPLPTRKRHHENCCCRVPVYLRVSPHFGFNSRALFFFLIVFLSTASLAAPLLETYTHGHRPALRAADDDDLAWREAPLYLDTTSPPPLLMPPLHVDDDATEPDPSLPSKRSLKLLKTAPVTTGSDFTVPRAFDTGLSSNFSSSCASFLNRLRQSQEFNSCDPFSLLLQTSSGFFDASKSTLRITQTLDATCGVDSTQCKTVMDSFAVQLLQDNACKSDYRSDNPIVLQAYNGLIAYQPAYKASCLHDVEGNYCFANAVSNTSSPGDAYPYYLPIGQQLPGGSRPTCNSCLQQVMGVFAFYSTNATQPISKTYTSAAQQISIACGSKFVNVTAPPLKGAAPTTSATFAPTITLILMFVLFFFQ